MDKKRSFKLKLALASLSAAVSMQASAVAINTDVITVVDESGSMSSEHAWLGGMITALDTELAAAAGTDPFSANYGLVGFGGSGSHLLGHTHLVGGGELGTAAQFSAATGSLVLTGGTEDGYSGIDHALSYSRSSAGAIRNIILVTDEDRDNADGTLNLTNITNALDSDNALLNAVLNISVRCGSGSVALGVDASGTGYVADGAGGFSTCTGASVVSGAGSSIADYVNLAFGTGGAAWDLNQLRAGGLVADSFTNAFVDVKVTETIIISDPPPTVPEPGTMALLGLGVLGLGAGRYRFKKS